uniref:Flavodoxin-like domain-containing protein n=1 Tax=Entomoneis paludosa TaxID=265537 RepID=A0A7S2V9B0_9STRA|mmetsp:Transcript_10486/g.21561  ORF Transcript_10486/g.21561 Transcript_10486/m.21561 type:complete len:210 (+) Transcript_10486:21-650(+)|eukprot:CAMPEP_0172462400 /NCGR_PEP_ID=MMETSP1065-20121228/43769_1 /TAXON_ID=265537 /ORGANISM="Amphiprora paludosa, Strain CCMP125" /LENGTH=209 /DNA_ID=CAMNT_0013218045 /DNA_START=11 /DNA_END=640 /DNA_ORIENTATION=+
MPERTILVLNGTTRGTSKKAAEKFADQCSERLSHEAIHEMTGVADIQVKCKITGEGEKESPTMTMDEFLKNPEWEPLVVIFVSSFGSGDGPRTGRKFRKKCDAWTLAHIGNADRPQPLAGISFALCGLGESTYDTYMKNPIVVGETLSLLGADMVGERGSADSAEGIARQEIEIETWMEEIWPKLAELVAQEPKITPEQLQAAREFVLS